MTGYASIYYEQRRKENVRFDFRINNEICNNTRNAYYIFNYYDNFTIWIFKEYI